MTVRAYLLWRVHLTRLGNWTARNHQRRHDRDYGGHAWTGR